MQDIAGDDAAKRAPGGRAADTPERRAFYERISDKNLAPLWTVLGDLVTPQPRSGCAPALWRFSEIRAAMIEAGGLITAKEAERRVLVLENPAFRGESRITTSLYAGVQLVLPGEVAPAHRHTQSALRFVMEGSGAHTAVDGEKTQMEVGDFVITPQWAWHDHGNETDALMFWLDGLDIPLVSMLDASFAEMHPQEAQPITRASGQSYAEFGRNLAPVDAPRGSPVSPIFNYPYAHSRETLETMKTGAPYDPCHGWKLRYVNPRTGGHAMPTMATFLQLLEPGATETYRSTDATVFCCVEGRGRSTIAGRDFDWGPMDLFVAPSWAPIVHDAHEQSILFSYSDRPVQEAVNLFREARGVA